MSFRKRPRPQTRRQSGLAPAAQVELLENRVLLSAVATDIPSIDAAITTSTAVTLSPGQEFASIDGIGNNQTDPDLGAANTPLLRSLSQEYEDGVGSPAGSDRPSAREVSNAIAAVESTSTNDRYLTDFTWIWGQFIDHDIDLTENAVDESGSPNEPLPIEVPAGDPFFDPTGSGAATIDFHRSISEIDDDGVRQQINQISAFLDGSVIYGSDTERAEELRTHSDGLLKVSDGELLPFNEAGLENAGGTSTTLFLAGDVRANENVALTSMHTIWVREHNRIATELAAEHPFATDEELYQQARAIVVGEIQAITYNEFLPALLGFDALSHYSGYDPTVDPGISNIFSTAAYRFGHSLLSPVLQRTDADGNQAPEGDLALQSAFFNPTEIIDHGVDSLLQGAATQLAQELDNQVVDDVRNFLFGPPGAGGFDLVSLNIQRGRDHGLPDYNQARIDLGLSPVTDFGDITSNQALAESLRLTYGDVNHMDVWVGGLVEDHLPGSSMGELFSTVIVDQFERIRAGDRFWYENVFSGKQLQSVDNTTLAEVIQRNSGVTGLQENVFFSAEVEFVNLEDSGARNVTIRAKGGNLEVINNRTHQTVSSRPVVEIEQVIVVGSDRHREQVTVAPIDAAILPGGLVINLGSGRGDSLTFRGTQAVDSFAVSANEVTVNGLTTQYYDIEQLKIQAQHRRDQIQVADGVQPSVVTFGEQKASRLTRQRKRQKLRKSGATELNAGQRTKQFLQSRLETALRPRNRR